jgi:N-acetyl-anhydromuramyl-L-alanine amidase AmpD
MLCDKCKKEIIIPKLIIKSDLKDKVIKAGNARPRNTNLNINKIILHSQGIPDNFGDVKALSSIQNWFTSYREKGKSSAHYFINFNGDIHLLVPEDAIAYHAGSNGNRNSIGIEMAGSTNRLKFTDEQTRSIKILINDIKTRHNIKNIFCHSDFGKPGCPFFDGSKNPLLKELNDLL